MGDRNLQTVDLLVRCALQSFEDTRITCPIDWTVRQLKQQLSTVCSSKPEAERQRLIYAGHCLQDERTLRSVFEGRSIDEDVRVVHLVCPPKDVHHSPAKSCMRGGSGSGGVSNNGIHGQRFPSTTAGQTTSSPTVNLHWMNTSASAGGVGYGTHQLDYNPQFHNVYHAYMTSYTNYMQQVVAAMNRGPDAVSFASSAATNNYLMLPQFPLPQIQQFNHAIQPVAGVARNADARAAANVVQDALPGDGDVPQRDLLDILHKAIRMCFLVMLVYVYSSAERFLGVLLFILAVWFVQARRDRNNRIRNDRQLANAVNNVRQPQVNNGEDGGLEHTSESDALEYREQTAWHIFWSTCYTFITSFFTSLFPDNPAPINVN